MRRLIALLIFTLSIPALAQARTLTPKEFTDAYVQEVAATQPSLSLVSKDTLRLLFKTPSGRTVTAFLDNAYHDYVAAPDQLAAILKKRISALVETTTRAKSLDRSRIVPVVKDRPWLLEMQKAVGRTRSKWVVGDLYESLNDELIVLYGEDTPQNTRYIGPKEVADVGVKRDELRALAIQNLRQLIPPIAFDRGDLFSRITAGGNYETSLLLFDDIWAKAATMVDGEVVVAVPARGLLLFTGSRNQAGVERLRAVAAKVAREDTYFLTPALFVRRGGGFVKFVASGG